MQWRYAAEYRHSSCQVLWKSQRLPTSCKEISTLHRGNVILHLCMYWDPDFLNPHCGRIPSEFDRRSWTIFLFQNFFCRLWNTLENNFSCVGTVSHCLLLACHTGMYLFLQLFWAELRSASVKYAQNLEILLGDS